MQFIFTRVSTKPESYHSSVNSMFVCQPNGHVIKSLQRLRFFTILPETLRSTHSKMDSRKCSEIKGCQHFNENITHLVSVVYKDLGLAPCLLQLITRIWVLCLTFSTETRASAMISVLEFTVFQMHLLNSTCKKILLLHCQYSVLLTEQLLACPEYQDGRS